MTDQSAAVNHYQAMLLTALPNLSALGVKLIEVTPSEVTTLLPFRDFMLRPGNSVAGPAIMGLADVGMYAALMVRQDKPLEAFTVQFNVNFLKKGAAGDLCAVAKVLRIGKGFATLAFDVWEYGGWLQRRSVEESGSVLAAGSGMFRF